VIRRRHGRGGTQYLPARVNILGTSQGAVFANTDTGFKQGTLSIDFPDDGTYEFDSITGNGCRCKDIDQLVRSLCRIVEMQWLVYEHSEVNKKIASVVIEPILLGAGGMKFIDPLWQRAMDVASSQCTNYL
jgi:hypothetical protein